MIGAQPHRSSNSHGLDAMLAELEPAALELRPPYSHERRGILRSEAAELLDRLFTRVARGRGALDVVIGEGLATLAIGDRTLRLGYSGLGDYARERLGMAGRTALAMARLARELRDRPLLRAAVEAGEVSARKAQTILRVARGEAEAAWTEMARTATVRALEAAVKEAGGVNEDDDVQWEKLCVVMEPEARATFDEALALAGNVLGAGSTRWQRLEALCQEYLGAHPADLRDDERPALHWPLSDWLEVAKEALETETAQWAFLASVETIPATGVAGSGSAPDDLGDLGDRSGEPDFACDPHALDSRLRHLCSMRDRWDELVGHLGMLIRMLGLWRDMKFASFGHYCTERLGMAVRTVEERVRLERRLYSLPSLRAALRDRRVSYEQARLIARHADDSNVDQWIARAERTTCIGLRRQLEGVEEAQMCARGDLDVRLPRPVVALVGAACRAARECAGRWLPPGECLHAIARHFIETWKATKRRARRRGVLERDDHCQVPGCSRAAVHRHHVVYRSRFGSDDDANLVGLCAAHHLHGVHRGWIAVKGRAPDHLHWVLGVRPDGPPLATYTGATESCPAAPR